MAGDTEVIKQFLVSLGFQIHENELKKFVGGLGATDNAAAKTAKTVLGVAIAAEAMVVRFSSSMEKLYYQSRRTGTSVENLQGLEFGSRKIGLAAGQARDALEGMVAAARMNPGLRGLIDGLLGKSTSGMDQSKVMLDLVQKLSEMPHYQGAQFAQMFGIDERTFLMLKQGLPELIAAERERAELNKNAGINADEAARAGKEYANSIRDITERVGVLRDRLAIELLPQFREFNRLAVEALDYAARFKLAEHPVLEKSLGAVGGMHDGAVQGVGETVRAARNGDKGGAWNGVKNVLGNTLGGRLAIKGFNAINDWRDSYRPGGSRSDNPSPTLPPAGSRDAAKPFAGLEAQYNLPPGLLDRIWSAESSRGKNMLSPKGAQGHFGFMPRTAAEMGVKDPNNLEQSAAGAAKYFSQLMQRYGGNTQMAAAAYNWGMGKLDRHGMGAAPLETRNYVDKVAGGAKNVTINNKTDIHVGGGDSAPETARAVGLVQDQVTGNMVRNMRGAIQ